MSTLAATAIYAGLNALILVWLSFEIIARRRARTISIGDGGDAKLAKLMRGHANAVETIPIALLLMMLAEMMGAPGAALHTAGIALTAGRMMHALHFTGRAHFRLRQLGMLLSILVIALLALGLIAHGLTAGGA